MSLLQHIQRNYHEREKKLAMEASSHHHSKHKVNSVNTRGHSDDTDGDEVGLVVQHALSADVVNKPTDTDWIVDSGATCHICHDRSLFTELENLKKPLDIILGDGCTLNATECGTVILILEKEV